MVNAAAQPHKHTIYFSLPRRAAMTALHLSRRTATVRFSTEGVGCQKQTAPSFVNKPIRRGFISQAFTRWRHQSEVVHI